MATKIHEIDPGPYSPKVVRMIDRQEPDQKIPAVQQHNPLYDEIDAVQQLFPHLRRAIEHFFTIDKQLEHKKTPAFSD